MTDAATEPALADWIDALAQKLDIDPDDVDLTAVLDLARDAAHNVERPAAPVTTFMVGYAAGLSDRPVEELFAVATKLAATWSDD
ncbi:DUF6457 domain-containing protein [Sanguibacter sp. 25GB23B1]|uniref:DUF6457 domain-containing protein n=1 Tax=unclassified Sanguibacter TaxID=2645534 RepID=UPI0032AF594E